MKILHSRKPLHGLNAVGLLLGIMGVILTNSGSKPPTRLAAINEPVYQLDKDLLVEQNKNYTVLVLKEGEQKRVKLSYYLIV